jgi:hypothetical protein
VRGSCVAREDELHGVDESADQEELHTVHDEVDAALGCVDRDVRAANDGVDQCGADDGDLFEQLEHCAGSPFGVAQNRSALRVPVPCVGMPIRKIPQR